MFELLRGHTAQRWRIATGLVLLAFTFLHFLNHAIGLISLDAMLVFQSWRTLLARSLPGTIILGGALLVHVVLALDKMAQRSTWRMEPWEMLQSIAGLLIPFLLLPHVVNTRGAFAMFGVNDSYIYELARRWPEAALMQTVLLSVVWAHGCVGLHYWLRSEPLYRQLSTGLLLFAVVFPLAALTGYVTAGREVAAFASTADGMALIKRVTAWPDATADARLVHFRWLAQLGALAMLAAVGGVWGMRMLRLQRAPKVTITYLGGPTITAPIGPTLLEMSRMYDVPHAAMCGGRSRCSTCRVRIERGGDNLPRPDFAEQVTLGSINAPRNVRLACQVRPTTDMTVARLLRGSVANAAAAIDPLDADQEGVERILVLLFLDVRNFTKHMEQKLPYDVVYILNEFFAATGRAITTNGGVIDKFLGDGLLAVFGRSNGPEAGCREALQAARAIDLALDHFNATMEAELFEPMRVGIGIHAGPLLLGRIGWGDAIDMTVIGHTVNAASRLEALTKEKKCQLIISRDVAEFAGWTEARGSGESIEVRGVAKPIEIITVSRGRDLPPQILGPGWSE